MADSDELEYPLKFFDGIAKLFPLPDVVLFPHVMQPLHVFEPRYRELTRDALASDQLLALAVLAPGWEADYEGRPPLYPTACLGRIIRHQQLEDGKFNLLVIGLRRVRLIEEAPPTDRLYRQAEVDTLVDIFPAAGTGTRRRLKKKLVDEFQKLVPNVAKMREQLDLLLQDEVSLAVLTDVVSYALKLDIPDKMELLAEVNVDRRAERLLAHLERVSVLPNQPRFQGGFPPEFSVN